MAKDKDLKQLDKHHFKIFVAEFKRTAALLGLNDWRLEFKFEKMDKYARTPGSVIHGLCDTDPVARNALIVLGKEVITENELDDEVRDTARHECMELLLSDMVAAAENREWSDTQYESLKHCVISRLCNLIEKIDKKSAE